VWEGAVVNDTRHLPLDLTVQHDSSAWNRHRAQE
jgi:hypothetical protein